MSFNAIRNRKKKEDAGGLSAVRNRTVESVKQVERKESAGRKSAVSAQEQRMQEQFSRSSQATTQAYERQQRIEAAQPVVSAREERERAQAQRSAPQPKYGYSTSDRSNAVPYRLEPERSTIGKIGQAVGKYMDFRNKSQDWTDTAVAGAADTVTFGALPRAAEELAKATGVEVDKDKFRAAQDTTAYKVGEFAGYLAPAAAIERSAAKALTPALGNMGKIGRGAITGATAGVVEAAGQELGDKLFRGREFDAENVALGGALGGAAGALVPMVSRTLSAVRARRGGQAAANIKDALPTQNAAKQSSQSPETAPIAADAGQPPVSPTVESPRVNTETAATRPKTPGERAFVQTLEQSGKLSDEVQQGLQTSSARRYEPITNVDTVAAANKRISKSVDDAEAYVLGGKQTDAEQVATGMRLIQTLQQSGQTQRAVTIAEQLAEKLTQAGQTVQAASIWNRLSPEGALLAAQRKVNRVNENLLKGQEPVKIAPEQAKTIMDSASTIQAAGASKERAGTVMEIMDRVRKGETITSDEKQTIADFVADAKRFLKPADTRPPRPAKPPKEMSDARVRDRVLSVLEAQEQAAKERLRAKGVHISSNPLDIWADYAYIGALKIAKGAVKFTDWSEQMIKEAGEQIRPHLRNIYEKAQETLNQSAKKINEQVISKAERVAEGYIKSNEAKLTDDDINIIRNIAQKVSAMSGKEQRVAAQDLQAVLSGFERAGVGRKLSAAQYISMLLNPKTQVRNIVGNELMYRIERISRMIATPIDMAASKITGGPRTITFKRGPSVWDDFFKPSKDYWTALPEGVKAGWRGVSPEGLTTKYEIQGQAFRSKYNPMTYLEKALGATLQGFDYAAYTRAVNQRLSETAYLDAINKGIKGDDAIRQHMQTYMANLDDVVHDIAKNYGKFATLQDDSALARQIMGFRRGLNKMTTLGKSGEFGAGSLITPFAKTPANLLLRGIDYSPAGIVKAISQAHEVMRKPGTDLTRADVITSVSRALFGTGMGAMAYWLADKGVMFGQTNDDTEVRKLQQLSGMKDFQINGTAFGRMLEAIATGGNIDEAAKIRPGDVLWGYEWAQPTSMPMAIGSNIYQSRKEGQGALQTAQEASFAGLGTLLDSSVLSGVREAFSIPPGQDNAWKAIALNIVKQAPSMFTPSFLRNINTLLDDRIKETYTPDDLQAFTAQSRANIPGLSQQMPQRVDTLGQPQTRPNSFFDVFISPSDRSKYRPTKEAQLVIDLLQETGDTRVAPRAVQKYLSGKDALTGLQRKVDLTPEQYVRLQTLVGQETAKRIGKINPNLPTDKKVELVIKALDEAGKYGRNELKKEVGLRLTK